MRFALSRGHPGGSAADTRHIAMIRIKTCESHAVCEDRRGHVLSILVGSDSGSFARMTPCSFRGLIFLRDFNFSVRICTGMTIVIRYALLAKSLNR